MSERLTGYSFALGAAGAYGVNSVLIRVGVTRYGAPLSGLAIGILVGLIVLLPLAAYIHRQAGGMLPRSSVALLLLSGITFSTGLGSNYLALSLLPVSVATPIASAYPLVAVLVARFFLQESERVTGRVILGALCVVAGTALVVVGRPAG